MTTDTGYSGKPLHQKLGFKPGMRLAVIGAPEGYWALLGLPAEAFTDIADALPQAVHLFATRRADLAAQLKRLRSGIAQDGMIWVSWPKKASGVPTDIIEDVIREVCLPMGLVDVKVCAVDATWSGLKLVIRKAERVT